MLHAFIQILRDAKPRDQAKIIRGVFEMMPPPEEVTDEASRKRVSLYKQLLGVAARLEADGQVRCGRDSWLARQEQTQVKQKQIRRARIRRSR